MKRYWRILRGQRRPWKFLVSRALMRLGFSRWLTIRQAGFVLRFHPSSLSAALWIDPDDHQAEAVFFRRYLRPGDVVLDVGANVGLTTLVASRAVGERGKVYAFEPHPAVFAYLEDNLALNGAGNVVAENVALGDREGTARISDMRSDDHNFIDSSGTGIEVAERRLDQLDTGESRISLLKIDVEGYERFVLEGAAKTLERTECVFFESWDRHFARYDYSSTDLLRWLRDRGWAVFRLGANDRVRPLPPEYASSDAENLIALRETADFLERTGFELEGE